MWGPTSPADRITVYGEWLAIRPSGVYILFLGWVFFWVADFFFEVFVFALSVGDPVGPPPGDYLTLFFPKIKKEKKNRQIQKNLNTSSSNLFFSTYPFSLISPAGVAYTFSFLSMGCADYAAHVKNKATTHVRYATLCNCICACVLELDSNYYIA